MTGLHRTNQTLQIPVQKNQRLIFSKKTPSEKIIKHDPYLSLYLVEDKNIFKHPFRVNMKLSLGTAAIINDDPSSLDSNMNQCVLIRSLQ